MHSIVTCEFIFSSYYVFRVVHLQPTAPAKKKKAASLSPAADFGSTSGSGAGSPHSNSVPSSPFLAQQAHKFMSSPNLSVHANANNNGNGNISGNGGSIPTMLQQQGSVSTAAQQKYLNKNPNVVSSPVSSMHKGAKFTSFAPYPSTGTQQGQAPQGHQQQPPYNSQTQSYQSYPQQMGHLLSHQKLQQPPPQQSPHMLYAQNPSQAQSQQQQGMHGHMPQQQPFGGPQNMGYSQNSGNNNNNNMGGGAGNSQFGPAFSVRDSELPSRGSFNLGSNRSSQATPSNPAGDSTKFFPSSNSPEAMYYQPQPPQPQQSNFFDDILSGTSGGLDGHRGLLQSSNHQSHLLSNLRLSSLDLPSPPSAVDDLAGHNQRLSQSQPSGLYSLQADAHLQSSSGFQQYPTSPPVHHRQLGGNSAGHHSQQAAQGGHPSQHISSPPQAPPPQLSATQLLFGSHSQAPYAFDGSAAAGNDSFLRDYSKH